MNKKFGNRALRILDALWTLMLAVWVLFFLNCQIVLVSGVSMAPALQDGEYHIMLRRRAPQLGDVVIFSAPDGEGLYVKRVVAGPGDAYTAFSGEGVLSDDEYFLVGDNLDWSVDSRYFGPVHVDAIKGTLLI